MRLVLAAALLLGCASGTVVMEPDGSCRAAGIAIGRAEIAAYRSDAQTTYSEDPNQETRSESNLCARVGGGSGSAAWYGFLGAAFGALVAALPALL